MTSKLFQFKFQFKLQGPVFSPLCQHRVLNFWILTNLTRKKWFLYVDLMLISLIVSEVEHIFKGLSTICISFPMHCPSTPFVHLPIWLLVYYFEDTSYILGNLAFSGIMSCKHSPLVYCLSFVFPCGHICHTDYFCTWILLDGFWTFHAKIIKEDFPMDSFGILNSLVFSFCLNVWFIWNLLGTRCKL